MRRCDLRQCRYVGLAKTRLQHFLTATSLNLLRLAAWYQKLKRAKTRGSAVRSLLGTPAYAC